MNRTRQYTNQPASQQPSKIQIKRYTKAKAIQSLLVTRQLSIYCMYFFGKVGGEVTASDIQGVEGIYQSSNINTSHRSIYQHCNEGIKSTPL